VLRTLHSRSASACIARPITNLQLLRCSPTIPARLIQGLENQFFFRLAGAAFEASFSETRAAERPPERTLNPRKPRGQELHPEHDNRFGHVLQLVQGFPRPKRNPSNAVQPRRLIFGIRRPNLPHTVRGRSPPIAGFPHVVAAGWQNAGRRSDAVIQILANRRAANSPPSQAPVRKDKVERGLFHFPRTSPFSSTSISLVWHAG